MKLTSRTISRTLAFVNRLRAEQGRKPLKKMPKGTPGGAYTCPIATALRAGLPHSSSARFSYGSVLITYYNKHNVFSSIYSPKYVFDFAWAFDHNRIPELIDIRWWK